MLAGRRLIARGCRRLAFFGETRTLELSERYEGVCQAAREAGLSPPTLCATHLASDGMADEIAGHVERLAGAIDGIAAASDVIAMHSLRALADRGIAVPEGMPVVGFDDLPFASTIIPRLTTIRQDIPAGAAAMARALFARMEGRDAESVVMAPVLVERDSG